MTTLKVEKLLLPEVLLLQPKRHQDSRGYFSEIYNQKSFSEVGVDCTFVQDNQSFSVSPGTIRGLHFQRPPHAQSKLVRVLRGAIFDVAVDLRRASPTFGKWCGVTLTADGGEQIFVPQGFAHGFCTLMPDTGVAYKVDDFYVPYCDAGIRYDDAALAIEWPVSSDKMIISNKDAALPIFEHCAPYFGMT